MEQIQHVGRLFRTADHALAREVRRHHEQFGITSSQGFLLGYLVRRQIAGDVPIFARDVERYFGVRHSSVSGVLQRMEQKGLIQLVPDSADRRCKRIVLTDAALDLREQIEKQIRLTEEKIFGGMTQEEIATFVRLLRLAAENLSDGQIIPPPLTEEVAP